MAVALALGMLFGLVAAIRKHGAVDDTIMTVALVGVAMPSSWLGIMLALIFAVNLGWLPTSGQGTVAHLVLPAIALGSGSPR
jgi:peptide/nickel transport system permease protein